MPRDLTASAAPYLSTVVEDYSKNLAHTSAAIGNAILWLTVVMDARQDRDGGPLADVRHDLEDAQTALNVSRASLTDALQLLERENKETRS